MTQKELIKFYNENGGLRCKYWSIKEIKAFIKAEFGEKQRVYKNTCNTLKAFAEIYQR